MRPPPSTRTMLRPGDLPDAGPDPARMADRDEPARPIAPPLAERALAERVRDVPPSGIRRFFDILATMDDVISLGVGEPDFDTPPRIVEAGVGQPARGRTHYTSNYGTVELRRALSAPPRAVATASATTRRPRSCHRRRVGGGRPRAAGDLRPRRRGDPPRAVVRRLRAGDHLRRRVAAASRPGSRTTSRSIPPPSRRRSRRGRRRSSSATRATRRARSCRTRSRTSWPASPTATTCSSTATRSTTASPTAPIAIGRSARCRGCATGRSSWAASARPTR